MSELPELWQEQITPFFPQLNAPLGAKLLNALDSSFKTGHFLEDTFDVPSTLLTPLTVINQLVEFLNYLEIQQSNSSKGVSSSNIIKDKCETLGFCTGFLTASAVSSSLDSDDLEQYGAVAIRLAVLIGAFVDAQEIAGDEGESISLAASWSSGNLKNRLEDVVRATPEVCSL